MREVIAICAAMGAAIPPLWVGYGYALKLAGLSWEAPIEVITLMMWLWPTCVPFWEANGRGLFDPTVFVMSLAGAVLVNAGLYAVIGLLGAFVWRLGRKARTVMARHDGSPAP